MTTKNERIDLRVPSALKAMVAEASEASGLSISAFIAAAARDQAERVLRSRQVLMLSNRDRDQFLAALDRPARPVPSAVQRAKKRYQGHVE
ncbi:hypothetical protein MNBD_GAMMA19-2014 [hydrothermal vent metagenome]|uniref:DUF1778 domain-containing protein n=1 Tax=hydrothermal vent metagenome TaxID=652676 RepID=A0A3B1BAS3_9ZZZZ